MKRILNKLKLELKDKLKRRLLIGLDVDVPLKSLAPGERFTKVHIRPCDEAYEYIKLRGGAAGDCFKVVDTTSWRAEDLNQDVMVRSLGK